MNKAGEYLNSQPEYTERVKNAGIGKLQVQTQILTAIGFSVRGNVVTEEQELTGGSSGSADKAG